MRLLLGDNSSLPSAVFGLVNVLTALWTQSNPLSRCVLFTVEEHGLVHPKWAQLYWATTGRVALAISASSFQPLVDISPEKQRPTLVSIVWSMLMVGIVAGAILFISRL